MGRRLGRKCDSAVIGAAEAISQGAMAVEILPAIRGPDVTTAELEQGRIGCQAHAVIAMASVRDAIIHPSRVIAARAAQVRCEDYDELIRSGQIEAHQQDIAYRIWQHFERELIVIAIVDDCERRQTRPWCC